jgi:preprotein translocase SecE subunit
MSKAVSKKQQDAPMERTGFIHGLRRYFLELKYEWQKVTTPSRKEWRQATIVVFTFVTILALIMFAFDFLVSAFFERVVY